MKKDLLSISDLTRDEILLVLDTAEAMREIGQRPIKKVPTLRGKTLVNLFYEPSTRTRTSFEIAEKRLSADTLNIAVAASSVLKGETLVDTALNIEARAPDMIVVRHASSGAGHLLSRICRSRIINAGDGMHEHPTQALLDAFTIRGHKKRIDGLKVVIVGDLLHSRVLRSNVLLLTKLGADVWVSGPPTFVPAGIERFGVRVSPRVDEAVAGADVIMLLRIQQERMNGAFIPSLREGDRIARGGRDVPTDGGVRIVAVPSGLVVCPGLIDMHVHLREPGQEHKETVATGAAAAVAGGFTAVACMPNTSPVNDNAGVTEYILKKAAEANLARVYPIGAVSRGQKGEQLAEIAELRQAGCVAITDDGHPVATAMLMRRALEYTRMFDIPVIEHCEEQTLKGDGVAHEGFQASALGLRGIPGEAESIMALRDISLAALTHGRLHIAHMSARQTLDAVRGGKARGVRVTCEVTPHHFVLTDEMLAAPIPYDTNAKMNPPLREAADRDAIIGGLADGSIDVIATDHAPHHYDEKHVEFDRAPFGITGLETALSLCFDRLVHAGVLPLSRLIELLAVAPARILRVPGRPLSARAPADLSH